MNNKKVVVCLIFLIGFILAACKNVNKVAIDELDKDDIAQEEIIEKEEKVDSTLTNISEASNQEAVVFYAGGDFIKSVFAVGGDMLFIYGINPNGKKFLGYMNKEENVFQEISVDYPENMRAFNMTVDDDNQCHILWMSTEKVTLDGQTLDLITYEESYITIVNARDGINAEIDVSHIFNKERKRPYCFITDRDGNYYFENGEEIVKVSPKGILVMEIICPGWVEGIGMGKSGTVYCTYENENGDKMLGKIVNEKFVSCELDLPDSDAIYGNISAGTDTEVLMYNKDGGVYIYDDVKNVIEPRIASNDLPIQGEEVVGYGFLGDGRLCLLTQKEETIFYYVPAGK